MYSTDFRIILVDNGSDDEHLDKITKELRRNIHVLIKNKKNLGFVKAVNQGLLASTAPFVVVMNNDTEAADHWLQKMEGTLRVNTAVCGPLTTTRDSWQGRVEEKPGYKLISTGAMVAFFCVMFRRDVLDTVGLLDEGYEMGLCDDDDYCRRVHAAGFRIALRTDLVIKHHHRSTFKLLYNDKEIAKMIEKGMKRFLGD